MSSRTVFMILFALVVGGAVGFLVATDSGEPGTSEPDSTPPEWMRGTGSIAVLVVTPEGEPVPGVLVRAWPEDLRWKSRDSSGRPPEDRPIESLVRELTVETLRERAERIETSTGEDGTGVLEGLADLYWKVAVYREGFHFEPSHPVRWRRTGGEVRFKAQPLVPLSVTILLPDGTEPDFARLDLVASGFQPGIVWAPDHRTVWIPPGDQKLNVRSGAYRKYVRKLVPVSSRLGESPAPLTIRLKARRWIRGRVIALPTDLGFPGKLRILQLADKEDADTTRILEHREYDDVNVPRGLDFRIDQLDRSELAPGRWLLGLVERDEVLATTVIEVTDGLAECEIVVPEPDPENHMIVSLLGRESHRHRWLSVHSRLRVGEETWHGPPGVPMKDGRFRVRHARAEGEVGGGKAQYSLRIDSDTFDDVRIPYRGLEDDEIEVSLSGPTSLNVRITGYEDSPHVSSLTVTLRPLEEKLFAPVWLSDRPPDREGNWFQEGVRPGKYELTVDTKPSRSSCRLTVVRRNITVKSGENEVVIPLPPLHTLVVTCEDPGYRFSLGPVLFDRYEPSTGRRSLQKGRVVFEHLPAGEYAIRASSPDREGRKGRVIVGIPATSEYRFDPNPARGLTVRIQDRKGTLGRGNLYDGNFVVSVDEREVTTLHELLRIAAASTHERGSLLAVRTRNGWEEIRIHLTDPTKWGGTFEETR